jgi:hypothetical protein
MEVSASLQERPCIREIEAIKTLERIIEEKGSKL